MSFILPGGIGQLARPVGFSVWSTINMNAAGKPPPGFVGPPNATGSFSNGNRTLISGTTGYVINCTNTASRGGAGQTGKYYFEIANNNVLADIGYIVIGVATSASIIYGCGSGGDGQSAGIDTYATNTSWTVVLANATNGAGFAVAATNTDRIGVAVDLSNSLQGNLNFRLNGNWLNQGSPSTTLGSGYDAQIPTQGGGAWIMASTYNTNAMTLNTGQVAFGNAIPSGYVAWG